MSATLEHESFRLPDGSLLDSDDADSDDPSQYDDPAAARSTSPSAQPAGAAVSKRSLYGRPCSPEEAAARCPAGEGGLVWHAHLLAPSATRDCTADGVVKPRRAHLTVRGSSFLESLVQAPDGRWLFSGVLNGWPGLRTLELRSITAKSRGSIIMGARRLWDAQKTPHASPLDVQLKDSANCSFRATLRAAPWSAHGYTAGNPGFLWWFLSQREAPLLAHGEAIFAALGEAARAQATRVHLFSHRYALKKESAKDKLTYHSAILLEWDHGRHCTVLELATLHGVGGRSGRVNWCDDRDDETSALYRALPPEMVCPWKGELAEIRCTDVRARSLDEFKSYVAGYTGNEHRFLDAHFSLSAPVRLYHRTHADVVRYLLNYMGRDRRYTEKVRNCQAFATDLYAFAAGKKGVEVFSSYLRPLYQNRTHLFLYDPTMYDNPTPVDESAREDSSEPSQEEPPAAP